MNYNWILFGIGFTTVGFIMAFGKKSKVGEQKKTGSIKNKQYYCNIGEVIMLNGIIFSLKGFWEGFSNHWFVCSMVAWMIVACLDITYTIKRSKYQNE